ncbi:MAG: hypothetical protein IRY91_05565 [Gemmatimonadaceae bacterium]|nr:hypothetical protein [Gemmatimonadaceae bacterium]
MTDARLQALYQQAVDARDEAERPACPAPEDIQALVAREGTERERLATLDHVMVCRACAREFELLRALRQSAPAEHRWRPATLAIAASLILAVTAGVLSLRLRTNGPAGDIVRGGTAADVHLIDAVLPAAGSPLVLRWNAVPGAISYTAEVLTPDGTVAARAQTTDTALALPDSVHIAPGTRYLWWVRASLVDGSERRSTMRPLAPAP